MILFAFCQTLFFILSHANFQSHARPPKLNSCSASQTNLGLLCTFIFSAVWIFKFSNRTQLQDWFNFCFAVWKLQIYCKNQRAIFSHKGHKRSCRRQVSYRQFTKTCSTSWIQNCINLLPLTALQFAHLPQRAGEFYKNKLCFMELNTSTTFMKYLDLVTKNIK